MIRTSNKWLTVIHSVYMHCPSRNQIETIQLVPISSSEVSRFTVKDFKVDSMSNSSAFARNGSDSRSLLMADGLRRHSVKSSARKYSHRGHRFDHCTDSIRRMWWVFRSFGPEEKCGSSQFSKRSQPSLDTKLYLPRMAWAASVTGTPT